MTDLEEGPLHPPTGITGRRPADDIGLGSLGWLMQLVGMAATPIFIAALVPRFTASTEKGVIGPATLLGTLIGGAIGASNTLWCAVAGSHMAYGDSAGVRQARGYAVMSLVLGALGSLAPLCAKDQTAAPGAMAAWLAIILLPWPMAVYGLCARRAARVLAAREGALIAGDRGLAAMSSLMLWLGIAGAALDVGLAAALVANGADPWGPGMAPVLVVLGVSFGRSLVHIAAAMRGLRGERVPFVRTASAYYWAGLVTSVGLFVVAALRFRDLEGGALVESVAFALAYALALAVWPFLVRRYAAALAASPQESAHAHAGDDGLAALAAPVLVHGCLILAGNARVLTGGASAEEWLTGRLLLTNGPPGILALATCAAAIWAGISFAVTARHLRVSVGAYALLSFGGGVWSLVAQLSRLSSAPLDARERWASLVLAVGSAMTMALALATVVLTLRRRTREVRPEVFS